MSKTGTFQHRERDGDGCACPIHRGTGHDPFTAPLGWPFAEHVSVDPISRERALEVYRAHHAYMSDLPNVNLVHHGIYFQGELTGAITYRYPLLSKKKIRFGTDGDVLPEPLSDKDYEALPEDIEPTARRIIQDVDPGDIAESVVVDGDVVVEAARICLGVRMPNLASAALARSQEAFVHGKARSLDTPPEYLLTFVRSDYDGAMIRALRDKGWTCTGWTDPSQASNRDEKDIRDYHKWRFLCPVEHVVDQSDLGEWTR